MSPLLVAWGPAVLWAAVLFVLSGVSDAPRIPVLAVHDKLVHLFLYSVLGSALGWGAWRDPRRLPLWVPVALGIVYGAVDEWHQSFVPRRDPSWADFGVDVLGILLGFGILLGALRRWRPGPGPRETR